MPPTRRCRLQRLSPPSTKERTNVPYHVLMVPSKQKQQQNQQKEKEIVTIDCTSSSEEEEDEKVEKKSEQRHDDGNLIVSSDSDTSVEEDVPVKKKKGGGKSDEDVSLEESESSSSDSESSAEVVLLKNGGKKAIDVNSSRKRKKVNVDNGEKSDEDVSLEENEEEENESSSSDSESSAEDVSSKSKMDVDSPRKRKKAYENDEDYEEDEEEQEDEDEMEEDDVEEEKDDEESSTNTDATDECSDELNNTSNNKQPQTSSPRCVKDYLDQRHSYQLTLNTVSATKTNELWTGASPLEIALVNCCDDTHGILSPDHVGCFTSLLVKYCHSAPNKALALAILHRTASKTTTSNDDHPNNKNNNNNTNMISNYLSAGGLEVLKQWLNDALSTLSSNEGDPTLLPLLQLLKIIPLHLNLIKQTQINKAIKKLKKKLNNVDFDYAGMVSISDLQNEVQELITTWNQKQSSSQNESIPYYNDLHRLMKRRYHELRRYEDGNGGSAKPSYLERLDATPAAAPDEKPPQKDDIMSESDRQIMKLRSKELKRQKEAKRQKLSHKVEVRKKFKENEASLLKAYRERVAKRQSSELNRKESLLKGNAAAAAAVALRQEGQEVMEVEDTSPRKKRVQWADNVMDEVSQTMKRLHEIRTFIQEPSEWNNGDENEMFEDSDDEEEDSSEDEEEEEEEKEEEKDEHMSEDQKKKLMQDVKDEIFKKMEKEEMKEEYYDDDDDDNFLLV